MGNAILALGDSEYFSGLQRLLELPNAIGRKALRVLDEIEGTQQATTNSANKELVSNKSLALFKELGVYDGAYEILHQNTEYGVRLALAMDGDLSPLQYNQFLEELDELAVRANTWLDDVDHALQTRLVAN